MRVEFTREVLNHQGDFTWIGRILHLVDDGRHEWLISDLQVVRESLWYQGLGHEKGLFEELIQGALVRSFNGSSFSTLVVSSEPKAPREMKPEDAFRYLNEPLEIIVENEGSDGRLYRVDPEAVRKKRPSSLMGKAF